MTVDEDDCTDAMNLLERPYQKLSLVIRLSLEDSLSNVGVGSCLNRKSSRLSAACLMSVLVLLAQPIRKRMWDR